jgi:hypothetical protein
MILYRFFKPRGWRTALTPDQTGANLPVETVPWMLGGQIEINRDEATPRIGASADEILDAVEKDGIFLWG